MGEDVYPTKKQLRYIRNFDCSKEDVHVLIDFIREVWWMPSWGFVLKEVPTILAEVGVGSGLERDEMLELHTGGWSGNEDVLFALKKNEWFYLLYWEESRRGGHEYFRIGRKK